MLDLPVLPLHCSCSGSLFHYSQLVVVSHPINKLAYSLNVGLHSLRCDCFCMWSTYAGLPCATNVEGLRRGSERRGGDHRGDYFSCCCVIARSLACD